MDIDVNEYVDTFQTSLIDMTYAWCRGAKFAEVRLLEPSRTRSIQPVPCFRLVAAKVFFFSIRRL